MLTKEMILAAPLPFEDVDAPAWGGKIRLRMMSGTAFAEYERGRSDDEGVETRCARIIAYSAVDEKGELLFTEADVAALVVRDYATLLLVGNAAMRVNQSSGADVEATEKKSDPSQAGASSSPSA